MCSGLFLLMLILQDTGCSRYCTRVFAAESWCRWCTRGCYFRSGTTKVWRQHPSCRSATWCVGTSALYAHTQSCLPYMPIPSLIRPIYHIPLYLVLSAPHRSEPTRSEKKNAWLTLPHPITWPIKTGAKKIPFASKRYTVSVPVFSTNQNITLKSSFGYPLSVLQVRILNQYWKNFFSPFWWWKIWLEILEAKIFFFPVFLFILIYTIWIGICK